jgi:hypothetical protein
MPAYLARTIVLIWVSSITGLLSGGIRVGFGDRAASRCGVADWSRRDALAAAILGQVGEQVVHRSVFGGVDELAAQAALRNEPGMNELRQMEG